MSDEKKHSAEHAAKMVLKKAYDVLKAHEAKSIEKGVNDGHKETQSLDSDKVEKSDDIKVMKKSEKLQLFVNKIAEKRNPKEDANG